MSLVNTTWLFNTYVDWSSCPYNIQESSGIGFAILFTSGGTTYYYIDWSSGQSQIYYESGDFYGSEYVTAYDSNGWTSQTYRTITILNDSPVPSGFESWLRQNAVQQSGPTPTGELVDTYWTFNDSVNWASCPYQYRETISDQMTLSGFSLWFDTEDTTQYTSMGYMSYYGYMVIGAMYDGTNVYSNSGWSSPEYQSIHILGGDYASNSQFASWLAQNATQFTPPAQQLVIRFDDGSPDFIRDIPYTLKLSDLPTPVKAPGLFVEWTFDGESASELLPYTFNSAAEITCNGKWDLTDTSWEIKSSIPISTSVDFSLNFTANYGSRNYTRFRITSSRLRYYYSSSSYDTVYSSNAWAQQGYRTINITGGSAVTNTTTLNWLLTNAVQVIPTYTITYNAVHGTRASKTVEKGYALQPEDLTPMPDVTGYKFIGWDKSEGFVIVQNVTINAQWETLMKIEYSSQHGIVPGTKYVESGYNLLSSDLPVLSEGLWRFLGWDKQPGDVITQNVVITASWNPPRTITYSTQYGDTPSQKTLKDGSILTEEELKEPTNAPIDQRFRGWYINDTPIEPGYEITGNITLTAHWTQKSYYTISYVNEYDQEHTPSGKTVLEGYRLTLADLPDNLEDPNDVIFHGWFYTALYTHKAHIDDIVESNITLYANWYDAYIITINDGDNTKTFDTVVGEISINADSISVDNGEDPWLIANRPDSEFVGLNTRDLLHEEPIYVIGDVIKTDDIPTNSLSKTVYASYEYQYRISYSTRYGTTPEPAYITNFVPIDPDIYLPELEARGQTFDGWYYDSAYQNPVEEGDFLDGNAIFYAKWIPVDKYTITYRTEYKAVAPKDIYANEVITEEYLPELEKITYQFDGWFYDSEYENPVELGDSIVEDTTFYGKWTWLHQYFVTFNTKGKCFPPRDQVVDEGESATKPDDPIADGYVFSGWYTEVECINLFDFDTILYGPITLHALWTITEEPREIDWLSSMQRTYEFYLVDPLTWKDSQRLDYIESCTINRDLTADTLGSASFECNQVFEECYIRVYMIAIQNGARFRFCLGTFLVQTPSEKFNGRRKVISMDGYTPLIELKGDSPVFGYCVRKRSEGASADTNIMETAYRLTIEHLRAPVVETVSSKTVYDNFLANIDDTWFSFISDFIANAEYQFALDEYGRVMFEKKTDVATLEPRWVYTDDNSSILRSDIIDERDLYSVPNVVEVIYSKDNLYAFSRKENNNEDSPISLPNRGRPVLYRDTNPNISGLEGEDLQDYMDAYAEKLLMQLSTLEHKVTYTHGFNLTRVGDGVMLNYRAAGLNNVKAKVISQTINCNASCQVEETAVYTTNLWR